MRILLDENLDWRLGRDLSGHQVESVPLIGWAGTKNGKLLQKASEAGFEVLITMDGSMSHQQNLSLHPIAIVALRAPSNRLVDTRPLMPKVLALLANIVPHTFQSSSEAVALGSARSPSFTEGNFATHPSPFNFALLTRLLVTPRLRSASTGPEGGIGFLKCLLKIR